MRSLSSTHDPRRQGERHGEVVYNHYAGRLGLPMPYTLAFVQSVRPTNPTWYAVVWETVTHAQIGAP